MARQLKFLVEINNSEDMDSLITTFDGVSFDGKFLVYCSSVEPVDLYPEQAILTFDVEGYLNDFENLLKFKHLLKKQKINFDYAQLYNECAED